MDDLLREAVAALHAGDHGRARDALQAGMDALDELPPEDLRRHLVGRLWAAAMSMRSALGATEGYLGRLS